MESKVAYGILFNCLVEITHYNALFHYHPSLISTGVFVFRSYNTRFGRGTGAILFDDMNCGGTEASLRASSCLSRNANPEYCTHGSDVGVRCDSIGGSGEHYSNVLIS